MFIVIHASTDGDRYSIHATEEAARKVYEDFKEGVYGEDDTVILAKINNPTDFGFGAYGDMYGADVLETSSEEMDEVTQLQKTAGIKK